MTRSRQYMSGIHLRAAHMFLQQAANLQTAGEQGTRNTMELSAYTSATILHSVCYLESNINEHYMDILDESHPRNLRPAPEIIAATREAWNKMKARGRSGVLQKYRRAAMAFGVDASELGLDGAPQALLHLRNALVHHQPEDLFEANATIGKETRANGLNLLSRYVQRKPWSEGVHSGTTVAVLWHETARWALGTAVGLAEAFHIAIDYRGPMQPYRGSTREKINADLAT